MTLTSVTKSNIPSPARRSACDCCRQRKSRCDGGKPSCRRCSGLGLDCHYSVKKQMGRPAKRRQTLAAALPSPAVQDDTPFLSLLSPQSMIETLSQVDVNRTSTRVGKRHRLLMSNIRRLIRLRSGPRLPSFKFCLGSYVVAHIANIVTVMFLSGNFLSHSR
ncbi:hypothetical protein NW760_001146 [Fusarium oxysporum]|nr:hypothetical protein NW760_001146 [Fusarium oxysporum]